MGLLDNRRKQKRNKNDWDKMNPSELTRLMANRYGRIEVLKMEIKQLQQLIDRKTKKM